MRYLIIIALIVTAISTYNQQQKIKQENDERIQKIASALDKYERVWSGSSTVISSVPQKNAINVY